MPSAAATVPAAVDGSTEQMVCMEVWGGTAPITKHVAMQGLEAWVYSRPCGDSTCGGDVYYASSCATGRISRLLVADVAGHGAVVGDLAGVLRGLMRQYVNYIDQGRFVRSMNEAFVAGTPDGVFATAVVSTFFAPTRRLTVCNAGHPQPLWYRAAERRWSLLRQTPGQVDAADAVPSNMPLGIMDLVDYQQSDLEMGTDDLMLFYTDALSEAACADGQMLCEAGLLAAVQAVTVADPAGVIPAVLAAVAALHPSNLRGDDVTLVLLRPTGRRAGAPLPARARGLARFAWAIASGLVTRPWALPLPDLRVANVGGVAVPWLGRLWRAKPAAAVTSAPPP